MDATTMNTPEPQVTPGFASSGSESNANAARKGNKTPGKGKKTKPSKGKTSNFPRPDGQSESLGNPKRESKPSGGNVSAEVNKVLLDAGISLSGEMERCSALVRTEQYFVMCELAYRALLNIKPMIADIFSLHEWIHIHALMLYGRIQNVRFDALGVKESAPTRIPLPKNLQVYQPIWSILMSIGTTSDPLTHMEYIPDGSLPRDSPLTPEDLLDIVSCFQFDWENHWELVEKARHDRQSDPNTDGKAAMAWDLPKPMADKERDSKIKQITILRALLQTRTFKSNVILKDGNIVRKKSEALPLYSEDEMKLVDVNESDDGIKTRLTDLHDELRREKSRRIRPYVDTQRIEPVTFFHPEIDANPGAYGSRLHWDPRIWLDYQKLVEIVSPVSLFSLSFPNETKGTYAWLLPRDELGPGRFFVRQPHTTVTMPETMMALILDMSTLPDVYSSWFVKSDCLQLPIRLQTAMMASGIKRGLPVETYGWENS